MVRLLHWLVAFVITQLVEVPIYRRALGGRTRVAFGASLLTHPVVFFVIPRVWERFYLEFLAPFPSRQIHAPMARFAVLLCLAEGFAVGVEAVYLRAFGLRRALAWSFVANGASVCVGLACWWLTGWP